MKKLLVALVLMISSSAFAAIAIPELNEADSKDMYHALSKWGTRMIDREQGLIRIDVANPRCIWQKHDQKPDGCTLYDNLHQIERTRTDHAAKWLAKLLVRHVGKICETSDNTEMGQCLTAARLIRCWHPWDPKHPPVLIPIGRRYICWLEPIRAPDAN